jgi:hypothetical protein
MNVPTPFRSKGARAAVLVLGVTAALYSSYRVGQAFAEWRQPRVVAPIDPASTLAMNPLAGAFGEGGHWSFANLDWDIRSQIVPAADVESQIKALVASSPTTDAELSRIPDASPDLLRFIKSSYLLPTEEDGVEIYRLERPNLKAAVVLRKIENRAKAIGGVVAFSQNNRDWQSFEVFPRAKTTNGAVSTHLLPLPVGAVQSGARTAADGQLLLEMITTKSSAESLLTAWKQAGWEVRPATLGNNASFSYLCARGNEIVYAWSADAGDSLEHLILTRSPSDTELQSQTNTPTN